MERSEPIDFTREQLTRVYLPDFLKKFGDELLSGKFNGEDLSVAEFYISNAHDAIEEVKNGDFAKAKLVLDFDINRKEAWKKTFTDKTNDQEKIEAESHEIKRLKKLREELESYD